MAKRKGDNRLYEQQNKTGRDRPLRVLMVTGAYPTIQRPHAGTFVKSQVDSLIEAGLHVEVLHPQPGPTPLRYLAALYCVWRAAFTRRFDIIHGHYGLWCVVARLQWTTPVVASFWGDDLLGTITPRGTYGRKSRVVAWVSRALCSAVDAVIVKSEQMRHLAGISHENVHVVPNGVNFAQFRPLPRSEARANLGWQQDGFYVLFGNNPDIPVKNFPLAQASIEHLRDRGIEAELIVANGLPHDAVVQYMNASNALLLTSRAEGSPNVVKEAMACNVPVVATNVGDVAAVIGKTAGCAICAQNADALAAGLAQALRHYGPTSGRSDIRHLDNALVAQRVIAIYRRVMKMHGADTRVERIESEQKDTVYAQES